MKYEITAAFLTKCLDAYEVDREQRLDKILIVKADQFRRNPHWWNLWFPIAEDDLTSLEDAEMSLLATGYSPEDDYDEAPNLHRMLQQYRIAIQKGVKHFCVTPEEFRVLTRVS